jgi:hypothetical protein
MFRESIMARCDEGYLCEVCGKAVENIAESDLYLRYVIGEIRYDQLISHPERHIRCNPTQAQFIVADAFEAVVVEGPFDKRQLDSDYVHEQEERASRGWLRLQKVAELGIPIEQYPLWQTQK